MCLQEAARYKQEVAELSAKCAQLEASKAEANVPAAGAVEMDAALKLAQEDKALLQRTLDAKVTELDRLLDSTKAVRIPHSPPAVAQSNMHRWARGGDTEKF